MERPSQHLIESLTEKCKEFAADEETGNRPLEVLGRLALYAIAVCNDMKYGDTLRDIADIVIGTCALDQEAQNV